MMGIRWAVLGAFVPSVASAFCGFFVSGADAKLINIASVMTRDPLTVDLNDTLEKCMGVMVQRHIRHLPVVAGAHVVGVISIGDIVKEIIRMQGDHIQFLETYIKGHGPY